MKKNIAFWLKVARCRGLVKKQYIHFCGNKQMTSLKKLLFGLVV